MKAVLTLLLALAAFGCTQSKPAEYLQPSKPIADNFHKKEECASKLEHLQEVQAASQFVIEGYYRTFYSPTRNSCLAAKYILYPEHGKIVEKERLEIDDLSNNETVWSFDVPCGVKATGMGEHPVMKNVCSDYIWNVEGQLDDYVRENGLEQ
jgi:hypothetical protein